MEVYKVAVPFFLCVNQLGGLLHSGFSSIHAAYMV